MPMAAGLILNQSLDLQVSTPRPVTSASVTSTTTLKMVSALEPMLCWQVIHGVPLSMAWVGDATDKEI